MSTLINESRGLFRKLYDAANDLLLIPLSAKDDAAVADAANDVATILALGGVTEQTSGGWARKTITNANTTVTVDDTNDRIDITVPEQTWTTPTVGNDVVALLVVFNDGGSDAARTAIGSIDFAVTANGLDVTTSGLTTFLHRLD